MSISKTWVRLVFIGLLTAQTVLIVYSIHRESLTFDEDNHMYAGYRMWKAGDYGLNPEHPPLVKLLATLPVLGEKLWIPPLMGIYFKGEAFIGGQQWIAHNDGGSQRLVFRMRLAVTLLALGLSLLIFFAAREWFGDLAAVLAMALAVFDPNLLAHSGLVTTDIGCALFLLAAIYTFYRYVTRPTWTRLLVAGLAAGLLLATKHSGLLVGPILPLMAAWEVFIAPRGTRLQLARRLCGACAAIAVVSMVVLWSFYGFRYAARPAGLQLVPTFDQYVAGLKPFERDTFFTLERWHLFPESYLFGLMDIRIFARFFNTFVLGRWYPHGVLWYFPVVITIKSTLALLTALALTIFAACTGKLGAKLKTGDAAERNRGRALVYLLIAAGVFLAVAIQNGLNIGVRHILPVYALAVILAGAGLAALAAQSKTWKWVAVALLAAHGASSMGSYPNQLAYANEAWGGPRNVYRFLTDSNVDWGQQYYQIKKWQDRHPGEECWFASVGGGALPPPSFYGITCHRLPNGLIGSMGGVADDLETIPAIVHGSVLISATEMAGGVWPSLELNPYRGFQSRKPDEEIDYGVMVFRGDIPTGDAAAAALAFRARGKLDQKKPAEALAMAEDAIKVAPEYLYAQWALGDAAAAAGKKDEARASYQKALQLTAPMDPGRAAEFSHDIQDSLKKL